MDTVPNLDENQIIAERRSKLAAIRKAGVAFPNDFSRTHLSGDLHETYGEMSHEELESRQVRVAVAGRMMLKRVMGKASFATLQDMEGRIQLFISNGDTGIDAHNAFKHYDLGDILGAAGVLFRTKTGELSVRVTEVRLLTKSLRPLPEKFHGLSDQEQKYRQRYLDLITNEDARRVFALRTRIIKAVREFFIAEGYLEVETPMMHPIPGGASAKPFETHHNALDMKMYLRIAPELYLKRLIIGGFEKIYEIGRQFRNEGMDKSHNPDFTELEFYWAYANYEQLMELTEELFEFLVPELEIDYQGAKIDLTAPFKRISMRDLILKEFDVDIDRASEEDILAELEKRGVKPEDDKSCRAIDALFKVARPKLIEPTFVTEHPLEMSPLAKEKTDTDFKKRYAERFQLIIGGMELINAYSELNDPQEQAKRLKEQVALHGEDVRYDQDFIGAMEFGLPPTAGWGLGVDRLVQLLTDAPTLREVILFPAMRDKE